MFRFSLSEFLDKFILLVAMVVFLLVGISSIKSVKILDTISLQDAPMLSESKVDVDVYAVDTSLPETPLWGRPQSQSRGDDWVFDVFTPPVLYYNPASREFTVTSPELVSANERDPWKAFEIELLEVRQRPYRLQLVGYAGNDGDYLASFEYIPTGEGLLARAGKLLSEAGVKILSFEVKQMEVEQEGSMPVFENVGVARLHDYESGQEIFLTNLETKIFSDLEAQVRSVENGDVFIVREGSQVELDNGFYIIGDLSENPQEAMVTKVSTDGGKRLSKLLKPLTEDNFLNRGILEPSPTSPFAIKPREVPPKPSS
jgi:hypothetical protein|tara:strand:- start:6319 stop:7263 length:945 start_codon:yes stop_codon:yes gene_type:complete